ncbi:MAG: phytanoyl-CoA dioxygenase family protein [Chloroflexi bacterium]|nr:phytanoyl-CoA dioxygenase family protein [Chloroflexota bacterium]MCY3938823.1 phytanoyl-CoA dioxygenase family protein [Chloroflexota bacterium]
MAIFAPNRPDQLVTLSQEQKDFYDENGYLVIEDVFDPDEVSRFQKLTAEVLRDPNAAHPRLRVGTFADAGEAGREPHPDNPNFIDLVMDSPLAGDDWFNNIRDPRIVKVMVDILGPNINFHNGKLRIKPPGYVNSQGWHQDWPYERHEKPELAASIFYVNETKPGAGATWVLPGSHKSGEWKHDSKRGGSISEDQIPAEMEPVELAAKAGSVAFIHVMVVHKAGHNNGDDSCTAVINEYKTAENAATHDHVTRLAFYDMPLSRGGEIF